ncbi:MAG: hypothetical protein M1503_02650 [Thaumarchaeota archaeon]|nr:hypothetical protein [Nitrososphaerota archaeon]
MSLLSSAAIFSPAGLIVVVIGLIIIWAVLSLPVYIAAKVVTGGKATLLAAMGATLLGPIVYFITAILATFSLGAVIGFTAAPIALVIAFIAWLAVYKAVFSTGWLGAFLIAIIAAIVFVIIALIITALLGPAVPEGFFDVKSF